MTGEGAAENVDRALPETAAIPESGASGAVRGPRDRRLDGLWWAGALIWAGLVLVADNLGQLPRIGGADAWSWIFLGAGLLALLMNTYRTVGSNLPRPRTWDWIWTGALILLGLGGFTNIDYAWPAILILAGLLFLVRSLRGGE